MVGEDTVMEAVRVAVMAGEETVVEEMGEVVMEEATGEVETAVVETAVVEQEEAVVEMEAVVEGTVVEKHSHNKIPQSRFVGIFHGYLRVQTNTGNDNCPSHRHMLTL